MALETMNFLNDFNTSNPPGTDSKSQGDDHIRGIKTALKATFPGMAGAAWRVQAKSSGYTVIANDNMSAINCTAALTLTLTAAATLGNQHMFMVIANGGDVTIDPNGAETVNGSATLVIPDGMNAVVICNGTIFFAMLSARSTFSIVDGSDGAGAGPDLTLYRNSSSPANADAIGRLLFDGEDDGGAQTTFASIEADIVDVADSSEDGRLLFKAMVAGTLTEIARTDVLSFVIGDTGDAKVTQGLVIQQGDNDDRILSCKSSDISHGGFSNKAEADTYFQIGKITGGGGGDTGGALLEGFGEVSIGLELKGWVQTAATATPSTAAIGAINIIAGIFEDGDFSFDANEITHSFRHTNLGGTTSTAFCIDIDGDLFADGSATVGTFDMQDDAMLLRSHELVRASLPENEFTVKAKMIKSRFDGNKYSKEEVAVTKMISIIPQAEFDDGVRSLIGITPEARVVRGAIWQNHEMLDAILEALDSALTDLGQTDSFQQKYVRPRFVERGLPTQILDCEEAVPK